MSDYLLKSHLHSISAITSLTAQVLPLCSTKNGKWNIMTLLSCNVTCSNEDALTAVSKSPTIKSTVRQNVEADNL
jgi:hypothetical protein